MNSKLKQLKTVQCLAGEIWHAHISNRKQDNEQKKIYTKTKQTANQNSEMHSEESRKWATIG